MKTEQADPKQSDISIFFAAIVCLFSISIAFGGVQQTALAKKEAEALKFQLRDASEAYGAMVAPQIVDMEELLDKIRQHESVGGTVLYGDGKLGRCNQSVGAYHMRVSTLDWLRASGRVVAPEGCEAQRKWLLNESNARYAAEVYMRLLLERTGDIDLALCLYNAGHNSKRTVCAYSGKVRNTVTV